MQRRALLGCGLAFCASTALAMSPARPVIRLSCPDSTAGADLCQALTQALSEAAPRASILRVARGDEAVGRAQDIGVAVQITVADAQGIGAQLSWQSGPAGPRRTGRDVRIDMMDTGLNRTILRHLANTLVKDDNRLQSALHALGAA